MMDEHRDCIAAARAELQVARRLLNAEVSGYPRPISGCDAQFNHLLAERRRVHAALSALDREVFIPTSRTPGR